MKFNLCAFMVKFQKIDLCKSSIVTFKLSLLTRLLGKRTLQFGIHPKSKMDK
jgi:hypothetical protein